MARRERGFALLVVLWTLVLVALIATQVTASGRSAVQVASNLRISAVLEAAADGAVHEAAFRMLDAPERDAPDRRWRADGTPRRVATSVGEVTLRLLDQAGKVNPNVASPEFMAAFLRQFGIDGPRADRLAAAIADWRFAGAEARQFGAKAREYRNAGLAYGPPDAPFESVGELGLVLGMTPDLLARLAPHLSVFNAGDPDPGLASREVMQALRALYGSQQLSSSPPSNIRVIEVTATARGPGEARFVRRAVLRIGEGNAGQRWQILAWDRGEDR